MEAWLKSDGVTFRFPVVPQHIEVDGGFKVDTEFLANGDEVSIFCGSQLKRTTLSSHFPSEKDRSYLDFYDFPSPLECVKIIEDMAKSNSEIRYIVTETEINMPVKILNFKRGPGDGSNDINFSLDLIEYLPPTTSEIKTQSKSNFVLPVSNIITPEKNFKIVDTKGKDDGSGIIFNGNDVKLEERNDSSKNKVKIYTVKHGDNLWDIAHTFYKDGSKYKKIKENKDNQEKYPKLKESNVIKSGWKLVIPDA